MKRALMLLAAVALVVVLVIGLTQAGGSDTADQEGGGFDLAQAQRDLKGAPAPLASLHEQSNELLEGGPEAFDARLAELRGHPVVINKWASWCGPCRAEFPIFQRVATERGKEIAFVGVNARDKRPAAERFARAVPGALPVLRRPRRDASRGR